MARIRNKRQQDRKRFFLLQDGYGHGINFERASGVSYGSPFRKGEGPDHLRDGYGHGIGWATSGVFQDCTTQGHIGRKLKDDEYRRTPSKARSVGKLVKYNITELANA